MCVQSYDEISTYEGITEGGASAVTTACFFSGMLFCVLLELLVHWLMKKSGSGDLHTHSMTCTDDVELASASPDAHGTGTGPGPDGNQVAEQAVTRDAVSEAPAADAPVSLAPLTVLDAHGKPTSEAQSTSTKASAGSPEEEAETFGEEERSSLGRMGALAALAIAVHNFPEGLATFMITLQVLSHAPNHLSNQHPITSPISLSLVALSLQDYKVGASLGTAIAVHNIPEGICVAMPIYYATGNKWKAFGYSVLSGLTEVSLRAVDRSNPS